jgi:hypothetical protein
LFQQFAATAREYYGVVLAEKSERDLFPDSAACSGNDGYFVCHLGVSPPSDHYEAQRKIRYNSNCGERPETSPRPAHNSKLDEK